MSAKDGPHGEYVQYGWHSDALAPAYNVAELGDMLPEFVGEHRLLTWRAINKTCNGIEVEAYAIQYRLITGDSMGAFHQAIFARTEAQARAAMLIYLLENDLMELPAHWRQDPNDPCADGRCQRGYSPGLQEIKPLPEPTREECATPAFEAAWQVMKDWTIQAPGYYKGSMEAHGGHVKLIVDAIAKQKWISVTERWPEPLQRVNFVVNLPGIYEHGKVYGGTYVGDSGHEKPYKHNGFAVPGTVYPASHWLPSPEPPQVPTGDNE
ncbi:hypothetical protein GCM10009415_49700 [Chitinophaga japonensis]